MRTCLRCSRLQVAIGIGGSYLGPLFVHTAMQFDEQCKDLGRGRCAAGRGRGTTP